MNCTAAPAVDSHGGFVVGEDWCKGFCEFGSQRTRAAVPPFKVCSVQCGMHVGGGVLLRLIHDI